MCLFEGQKIFSVMGVAVAKWIGHCNYKQINKFNIILLLMDLLIFATKTFPLLLFAGLKIYEGHLASLVLSRTFTCLEIITLGKFAWCLPLYGFPNLKSFFKKKFFYFFLIGFILTSMFWICPIVCLHILLDVLGDTFPFLINYMQLVHGYLVVFIGSVEANEVIRVLCWRQQWSNKSVVLKRPIK